MEEDKRLELWRGLLVEANQEESLAETLLEIIKEVEGEEAMKALEDLAGEEKPHFTY
jgi:rubrerythrin